MKAIDVIRQAYATSRHNEAGRVADESGELLTVLNTTLRGYMADGARVNKNFFGDRLTVEHDGEGWGQPPNAEMIVRLEAGSGMTSPAIVAGTEIVSLPFDQRHIEPGKPAVYTFGQKFYPAGRAGDPGNGKLVIMTAAAPADLTSLDDELPASWPETFITLPKWELAIYLAQKDGERADEVTAFERQLAKEVARFEKHLESALVVEVRSYGHSGKFNSPRVTPR